MESLKPNGETNQQSNNYSISSQEKCYIINTSLSATSNKVLDGLFKLPQKFKYVYRKNITGFTFCTSDRELIDKIIGKHTMLNIEEDKIFRIGSVENDKKYLKSIQNKGKSQDPEGTLKDPLGSRYQERTYFRQPTNNRNSIQTSVPLHFFRMRNMGKLFFNNFILDNLFFRLFGINNLLKYFYSYSYVYSGRKVKITSVDTPIELGCNVHSRVMAKLLVGSKNSFAKDAKLIVIDDINCDGTIWLSKLLFSLEKVENTDVLVLPISGPHSEALDDALKRISQKSIIVSASGNDSDYSCNYSPNGHNIIKVGSVDKNGYISDFSNRGGCNRIYALGEGMLNNNGTSYSAAMVASAVAIFLEKYPKASMDKVMQFLVKNASRTYYQYFILRIPYLDASSDKLRRTTFYSGFDSIMFTFIFIIFAIILIFIGFVIFKRYRRQQPDERFALRPLDDDEL